MTEPTPIPLSINWPVSSAPDSEPRAQFLEALSAQRIRLLLNAVKELQQIVVGLAKKIAILEEQTRA